ncbi:MAG: PilZ domain-containing protein [Methylococcaceae bacterium]|nr:PilZ domain-containing protein [Methylococcaceae bacterium]
MKEINEKRDGMRMNVSCEIHCKPENSTELYRAWCVTLSGSGISFFTEHEFKAGDEVEVNIEPENEIMKAMNFFIKVVRSNPQNNGLFEVGANIFYK